MKVNQLKKVWDNFFEYDRIGERMVYKSINLWNSNKISKQIRAMFLYNKIRNKYGCSINPRIKLGSNCYIAHMQSITIGQTAEIGDNCKIYPNIMIIAKVKGDIELVNSQLRRHPKIGNNCIIGAGSY